MQFNTEFERLDEDNLATINEMAQLLFEESCEFAEADDSQNRLEKIIVTLGKHGVVVATKDSPLKIYEAQKIDPSKIKSAVGSGDCFLGGVIYGLENGKDIDTSIHYGQ